MIDKSEDKTQKNTTQINPENSAISMSMSSNFPILNKKSKKGKAILFNSINSNY
jgi:hypothetical protein